ncbi:CT583 family protein [Candidatus Chlamydia sanziniae]|uniref:Virulence plasmid protein pGP6-D n=1 Tax=Candidatus Chlamydia sanziniae TaxID=1806891 RepID=A0A1A9HZ14_9CHLA|nr:CT583 family protein [Candidatus Chlamydia sanziniae]ANH79176.1 Virulence plasmid protein pGP6-D [Candidatus Chlamydia sanziniae]
MNKLVKEAALFFQKNQKSLEEEFQKKNMSESTFIVSLNPNESEQLNNLFVDEVASSCKDYSKILHSIKTLTCQIKSIQKQHVLLIGEKIYKARKLFQILGSSEGTFSSWIDLVFHTKSSAYNALAYYELFINLPNKESQCLLQSIPYKAAYLLASRKGPIGDKITVIKKIQGLSNTAAIALLNKYLPSLREAHSDCLDSEVLANKLISNKLLDLLKIVSCDVRLSPYNLNLLQQLFNSTIQEKDK